MIEHTLEPGELYLLKDSKPEIDPMIDKYAVLCKFMNEMKINGDLTFEISKSEFIDIQKRLNKLNSTETELDLVDIIELNVGDRTIKFKIKD